MDENPSTKKWVICVHCDGIYPCGTLSDDELLAGERMLEEGKFQFEIENG
jgi:hypothetical protein